MNYRILLPLVALTVALIAPVQALEGAWTAYNGHWILQDGNSIVEMYNYTSTNFTWKAPNSSSNVHYLIIGNAGSGAGVIGGGGGAGGFIEGNISVVAGRWYNVTIGPIASNTTWGMGGNTTWNSMTAWGGGNGAGDTSTKGMGYNGSSGGGATGISSQKGGIAWSPYGRSGGAGSGSTAPYYGAGGGGGYTTNGTAGSGTAGGNGGAGRESTITGSSIIFSAGGGGSYYTDGGTAGIGGSSCGGNADGGAAGNNGKNGTLDRGCGGGGGGNNGGANIRGGGFGSTGVVIMRYTIYNNFAANVTSGVPPLTVRFTNTSTSGNYSYANWSFGDGSFINTTANYVDHTYTADGNYTVMQLAKIDGVYQNTTKTNYITTGYLTPTANYTWNKEICVVPCTVQFNDTSENSPTSWSWNLGDGNTSTLQNPAWTYDLSGVFGVNLTVTNPAGSDSTGNITSIHVAPRGSPLANFTATPTTGTPGALVTFTDLSTEGTPTAWYWNFGDGQTSNEQNPLHVYPYASTYSVTLSVQNAAGYTNLTKQNYIIIATNQEKTSVVYPPKEVRFHLQEFTGASIPNALMTATPLQTPLGSYEYVANIFGYTLTTVPLDALVLSGRTDSRGDISFTMMSDVMYMITASKTGFSFTPMNITPHDDNYVIYAYYEGTPFFVNGSRPAYPNAVFTTQYYRQSTNSAIIWVNFTDTGSVTTSGQIMLYQTNRTVGYTYQNTSDNFVYNTTGFSGTSASVGYRLVDGATAACPASQGTIYAYPSGQVLKCVNTSVVNDQSYLVKGTAVTPLGNVVQTGTVWLQNLSALIHIYGVPDYWIVFFVIVVTVLAASEVASAAGPGLLVACFEGWVFYGMGQLHDFDEPQGTVAVLLTVATITTVVFLAVAFRRSGK